MASLAKREDWRARYRDAAGNEHSRHFKRKVDAQHWLDEVTTAVTTGMYVDLGAHASPTETGPRSGLRPRWT